MCYHVQIYNATYVLTSQKGFINIMLSSPEALLLAGPAVSLPNMIVLNRIMGTRKTLAYITMVILCSTAAGYIYGNFIV